MPETLVIPGLLDTTRTVTAILPITANMTVAPTPKMTSWEDLRLTLPYQLKGEDRDRLVGLLKRIWGEHAGKAVVWLDGQNAALCARPRDLLAGDMLSQERCLSYLWCCAENQPDPAR